ncbi:MAG: tRNA pseudouridine(55) synthase TruB [Clostridiales bacterium]|nr:tRNA pseudouridine(55) synthase TruB [Clostridiales bacterium]
MNGLISLYKPPMMSSAQAVARVRRILGVKTVGHMGTLDPMAEGVLVIGVGKSTRLFDYLINRRKTYMAKFEFGYATDTLDALGKTVATTSDIPSAESVLGAMRSMIGKIEQVPPEYSAKHVGGKRAYALARNGQSVELKPSTVEVYDAQLVCQPKPNETVFLIECSAGTYIRSLCRDAAKMCGSLATLTYLQRTKSGCFDVSDSISLDALEVRGESAIIPPDFALGNMQRVDVPIELKTDLRHGRKIECDFDGDATIYCDGELYGIGRCEGGMLKLKTYLKEDAE